MKKQRLCIGQRRALNARCGFMSNRATCHAMSRNLRKRKDWTWPIPSLQSNTNSGLNTLAATAFRTKLDGDNVGPAPRAAVRPSGPKASSRPSTGDSSSTLQLLADVANSIWRRIALKRRKQS